MQRRLDTAETYQERWARIDAELGERQLGHLRERFPGEDVPPDRALAAAFSTSRTDTTNYDPRLPEMTDAGLRWALTHERTKVGMAKLRREARRRGWRQSEIDRE